MKTVAVKVTLEVQETLKRMGGDSAALAICNEAFKCETVYLDGEQIQQMLMDGVYLVIKDVVL